MPPQIKHFFNNDVLLISTRTEKGLPFISASIIKAMLAAKKGSKAEAKEVAREVQTIFKSRKRASQGAPATGSGCLVPKA